MLLHKYEFGNYKILELITAYWSRLRLLWGSNQYDLVWIEKEAIPWMPARLECWLLRNVPYVLDYDDATFHTYDLHSSSLVRYLYKDRIDLLMKKSKLVVTGNQYLAHRANLAQANNVEIIPTVVNLLQYKPKQSYFLSSLPRIVWIGSPSTARYLLELAHPLAQLAKKLPFRLCAIGAGPIKMNGVDLESIEWSLESEANLISECDVGIMPLQDDPWEQGKCAYKLIQYMACGLPTVASPIGANNDVTVLGQTGLFANTSAEWVDALFTLLSDKNIRDRMGKAGRKRIETNYSLQDFAPKLLNLLSEAGSS